MASLPDHVTRNREAWTELSKAFYGPGKREWQQEEITWGIWGVRESEVQVLGDVAGKKVVELGCGTAYVSAWLARRGADVVGIDITPAQLANAREFQREFGVEFPLIEASAEDVPLESGVYDLAISEYGASIWCDPYRWIPEAARLLRSGGRLVFLRNSTLSILCSPDEGAVRSEIMQPWPRLKGPIQWQGETSIEFQLPHGEMVRLLRQCGFLIENLVEIVAPESTESCRWDYMTLDWGKQWPSEEIWVATKL